jgi:L-lactate dehydrogenase complex protein LldF
MTPAPIRWALQAWAALAKRAGLYHLAMRIGIPLLGAFGRRRGALSWLPLAGGWTDTRDLPAPQGRTFQQAWSARNGARS